MQNKMVGLLHGMSRVATMIYYERLNDAARDRAGGHSAVELLLFNVNFAKIEAYVHGERWAEAEQYLAEGARRLEAGGADFVMLGSNTMHRCAPAITAALSVPFLDLIDVTIAEAKTRGASCVGVLGTQATMEGAFYRDRLAAAGLRTVTPEREEREDIDRRTFDELTRGQVTDATRAAFAQAAEHLVDAGADAVALACTEHGLALTQQDFPHVPVLDTALLHVDAAIGEAFDGAPADIAARAAVGTT